MKLYFAPMGYRIYFSQCPSSLFHRIDRYYTPFITTHKNKELTSREKNHILPEHGDCGVLVLSNNGEDFIKMAHFV